MSFISSSFKDHLGCLPLIRILYAAAVAIVKLTSIQVINGKGTDRETEWKREREIDREKGWETETK